MLGFSLSLFFSNKIISLLISHWNLPRPRAILWFPSSFKESIWYSEIEFAVSPPWWSMLRIESGEITFPRDDVKVYSCGLVDSFLLHWISLEKERVYWNHSECVLEKLKSSLTCIWRFLKEFVKRVRFVRHKQSICNF